MSIKTIYRTDDGKEFESIEEAEEHLSDQITIFTVSAYPDLTEGRHGPKPQGLIKVAAASDHKYFATYACYKMFGNPITFVQGVFGSNAIVKSWALNEGVNSPGLPTIATVQDKFCNRQLYPVGVTDIRGKRSTTPS